MKILLSLLFLIGCTHVNRPRIIGVAMVGGSQMNNDNFFGNFYEREDTFNRVPGSTFGSMSKYLDVFTAKSTDIPEEVSGKPIPGIGIKIKGEF